MVATTVAALVASVAASETSDPTLVLIGQAMARAVLPVVAADVA